MVDALNIYFGTMADCNHGKSIGVISMSAIAKKFKTVVS